MTASHWLTTCKHAVLGRDPHLRRHVFFALLTLQPYAVTVGAILHSRHLGMMDSQMAYGLTIASIATFLGFFALVRSGWSQRFADPVLTLPHAAVSISLCLAAYCMLGPHRANTFILMAQTIVVSMFRLRPAQVLTLGVYTVTVLTACVLGLWFLDAVAYPAYIGGLHLVVGGSSILMLALIGKWVSEIRVRIGRQAKELAQAFETVQQLATTDMLTGIFNRRVIADEAELELKLLDRHPAPLSVALLDIDHFKRVNDHFGHHAGDVVLKTMAQCVQANLRAVDKFGRWGGEEFLLVLPRIGDQEALAALERIRLAVANLSFPGLNGLQVTVSAGVARAMPGESLDRLVERADAALYEAKRSGRDRCLVAKSIPQEHVAGSGACQEVAS